MSVTAYVVICRGDPEPGTEAAGPYELATRTVFTSLDAATWYAGTVNPSREPLVIPGRWGELRWDGEERFRTHIGRTLAGPKELRAGDTVFSTVRGQVLSGTVVAVNDVAMTVRVRWEDGTWSDWFRPEEHDL